MSHYQGPQRGGPQRPAGPGTDPFDGATLRRSSEILEKATGMLARVESEKREIMELLNQALWCDIKGHAFSAKDKGKRSLKLTKWDDDLARDVEDIVMVCGPCASANPLIQAAQPDQPDRPVRAADVQAQQGGRYSPQYTAELERDLGMEPG